MTVYDFKTGSVITDDGVVVDKIYTYQGCIRSRSEDGVIVYVKPMKVDLFNNLNTMKLAEVKRRVRRKTLSKLIGSMKRNRKLYNLYREVLEELNKLGINITPAIRDTVKRLVREFSEHTNINYNYEKIKVFIVFHTLRIHGLPQYTIVGRYFWKNGLGGGHINETNWKIIGKFKVNRRRSIKDMIIQYLEKDRDTVITALKLLQLLDISGYSVRVVAAALLHIAYILVHRDATSPFTQKDLAEKFNTTEVSIRYMERRILRKLGITPIYYYKCTTPDKFIVPINLCKYLGLEGKEHIECRGEEELRKNQ